MNRKKKYESVTGEFWLNKLKLETVEFCKLKKMILIKIIHLIIFPALLLMLPN
jgi:hypothetical protein